MQIRHQVGHFSQVFFVNCLVEISQKIIRQRSTPSGVELNRKQTKGDEILVKATSTARR